VSTTNYRKAFRDIVRGFSTTEHNGALIYIKHLTPHDQVELEDITELYKKIAQDRGLPTEEEMLEILREGGDWTEKDEEEIERQERFINTMEESKKNLVLKSAQDQQNKIIERELDKLNKKKQQRLDLLGNTCERYAEQRTHDFYILRSFQKDKAGEIPLYTEEEYDELDQTYVSSLVNLYNDIFNSFTEESIQYLVLEEFYQPYLGFSDDSMQFYGVPFCKLTYNQIRMIVYTRIFKSIYENNRNIPEKIKKDPKALLDYGSISDEEKEKMKSKFEDADGATLVGATDEDYEYLGMTRPNQGVSLHEEAKKKGGSLSMQDMMKLSGAG
tara:strand:- start:8490 stop:9476 length:987 start_codon:yes stop_codon:yes gene_type:complete